MARLSKYDDPNYVPEPPPANAAQILGAALLGSELSKTGRSLLISFDEPDRDISVVRRVLTAMRDCYEAPKD